MNKVSRLLPQSKGAANHSRTENNPIQDESIHKIHSMRVVSEFFPDLNKATDTNTRQDKTKLPLSRDTLMFTGTFGDGVRRIDVVLVIQESNIPEVEDIKAKFFTNLIKTGLQIESSPGVMAAHKNLIFVKVHAPDPVLIEYGEIFGVKSHFKNSRIDFITPKRTLIENIFAFTKIQHEREWIKIIRKNYRGPHFYSNAERSLIVYKILLLLPFGTEMNYLGLNRLLNKNIILDAYALHDGPYFFLPKQEMSLVSARQILCYNWVGLKNMFKVQPLDLIHEYFGTRIGFYFGFYGFYNQALAVAALVGILTTFLEFFDSMDNEMKNDTCEADDNVWICPECEKFNICPFRRLKDYCEMVSLNIFLDNPFTVFFSIFIVLWATLFVIFWRRREYYWKWMWELDRHNAIYQRSIRPDFEMDYYNVKVSQRTGIMKYYESGLRKFWRFLFSKLILLLCILGIMTFVVSSLFCKDQLRSAFSEHLKTNKRQYTFLALFQATYVILITLIEKFCKIISYYLVNFENHRTYMSYERSLVIKLFGYTFALTFSVILYIAWFKGLHFLLPIKPRYLSYLPHIPRLYLYQEFSDWLESFTIFNRNCGPFSCINELWILLLIVLFLKQIVFRVFNYFTSLTTDYNQRVNGKNAIGSIPCWELEYRLKPVTEELMMDKYNTLAQQFGLVTLFVAAFPLAPLFALLINIWDVRYHARLFLLSSRRPLLLRRSGLGAWTGVFIFISILAIWSNAFTIVRDTRTVLRIYYFARFGNLTGFLNYTLFSLDTSIYKSKKYANELQQYKDTIPDACYIFSGLLVDVINIEADEDTEKHESYDFSKMKLYETLFIFLYEHVLVCIVVILHYLIPWHPSELKETQQMENKIKEKIHSY